MRQLRYVFGITLLVMMSWFAVAQSSTSSQNANPSALPSKTASSRSPGQTGTPGNSSGLGRQLSAESNEAAGEEEENAEFKESPSVKFIAHHLGISVVAAYWMLIVLNFAIIAGAIVWFWRAKMPTVFRNRTEAILKSMETARKASEDANRRLKDVETRLARLDSEIAQMKSAAEAAAKVEELRIQEAIEQDKKKIVESAEQEIDAAARAARAQLKSFAADLAVGLAEKQIRVDPKTDQALVRGFGKQLAESSRNGKENS